ncbi:MAG TPA: exonuclease SbcCD subunit D C-terminal domain-containing protein, partial [Armatimonadota bacterium]
RLLAERGLHVVGPFTTPVQPLLIPDEHGAVGFYPVPYAEPAVMREALGEAELTTHEGALRALLGGIRTQRPSGLRSVVIAHAFVAGGATADDSERPLSVGGTASVSTDVFAGFDYVALGHLHRPQTFAGDRLHYAGSLLPYSFDEADQPKSVSLVEMDAQGLCHIERIALTPRRAVRRISGLLQDLLNTPDPAHSREDYLEVTLLDRGAILDPMGKLREVYPNVLHLERPVLMGDGASAGAGIDHRALEPSDLFAAFYAQVTGTPIEDATAASFADLANQFALQEREALPL